jgi:tetratricopeptide (TPR) repeat protein
VFPALSLIAVVAALQEPPRAVVRHATAAVDDDSVTAVRTRWERAARGGADRGALLGLATIARLTYDFARADSLYMLLHRPPDPDAIAAYALLGRALAGRARGAMRDTDSLAAAAARAGAASGDTSVTIEARILLATTRARTAGPAAAESLFHEIEVDAHHDPALAAAYQCGRAEMLALSFRAAGAAAREGAALAERAGDRRLRAQCLHIVAADLMRRGAIFGAVRVFHDVATLRRSLHDRSGLASTLQWRGAALNVAGYLQEASRDLEEAVTEGRASGNGSAEAWAFGNLASVSMSVGDVTAAAAYADSATRLFAQQGDRYGQAGPQIAVAAIALSAGQLDRAREAYRKAIALLEPLGFAGGLLVSHLGLAHVAMRNGDWDEAARELDAAERAGTTAGQEAMLRGLRYHRSMLALRRGELDFAERVLAQQLRDVQENARRFPGAAQPNWEYFDATRLAEVKARRGQLAAAETLALSAAEALDRWRAGLSRRDLRLQAYQVSEDRSDPDLGTATVIAALAAGGREEAAFQLAERLRARELLDHLARAEGLGAVDSARESAPQQTKLGGVAARADIAAALPDDGTAVLEFVTGRGGEPTTLFVLTRDALRAYPLAAIDSLEPLIDRFNALLESNAEARGLGRDLGRLVMDEAIAALSPGVSRLVIVPDGALHRVPFDALVADDGRFLVERFAIGVSPSATVAARLWRTRPPARPARVLALADPALPSAVNATSRSGLDELARLPRLVGSRDEARLVARFAAGSTVRLGRKASEAWFESAPLRDYRVLHLATHARADEATLSGTAIALAAGDGADGLVGPGELGRLALDADLVVLSACRSGGGVVVRGEGIVGLAAPLIEAGARSIALTRWTIGDRQTVSFIEAFYRALAAGQPVVDALRTAKLDAIARGAPPAQWAAFTIIGNPAVAIPLTLPSRRPGFALVLSAALLVLLASGWVWRRRSRPPR